MNFDQNIERRGTASIKWDLLGKIFGARADEDCLPLWVADMDFLAPEAVITELKKRVDHGVFGYSFADDEFWQIAVAYIQRHYHWEVEPDWLNTTPGIVPALSAAVAAFCKPGDKVMSFTPAYGPFFDVSEENGCDFVDLPLKVDEKGQASIDFAAMEKAVDESCRLFLLCSPHNPSGRVWSREELTRIGDFCIQHDLILISDEIHADFLYDGRSSLSIASLDPRYAERSMTCFAPSKTYNIAGLGASIIVIPNPELKARFDKEKNRRHLNGDLLSLTALKAAWSQGDEYLQELLVYLQANRDVAFEQINACPGLKAALPEATYLLWIDCRELMQQKGFSSQDELSDFFVHQAKVCLNPGTFFGAHGEGFVRLNFGCPRARLLEALRCIREASERLL